MARFRWALALSCLAGLAVSVQTYLASPPLVPTHYGPSGIPDRWGSPHTLLLAFASVIVLESLLFAALPELLRRAPKSLINLPNKDYWLSPERREQATAKFARWAAAVGIAVNVLMITLQLLLPGGAGTGALQNMAPGAVVLGVLLFTLGSCVWLVLSYRLPSGAR